jgi:Flp pilus assembly protein protease CpaA
VFDSNSSPEEVSGFAIALIAFILIAAVISLTLTFAQLKLDASSRSAARAPTVKVRVVSQSQHVLEMDQKKEQEATSLE